MRDCAGGPSPFVMDDSNVFLSHRGPDVKATFVSHLDDALRCAGFRPFLDARSLMKGNPAFKSIDRALDTAQVHVAVVSGGYADSKYCLDELVAMMRSGKPVIPVFYGVEPMDLRVPERGQFAEAFEKHKAKGRTAKRMREWRGALGAVAEITGFRSADYRSDEAKLKREVVDEVARLTPSNEPVEVEHIRVGVEGPARACIEMLDRVGGGTGMLGLVGIGGVGKTTLAREVYNHFVAQKRFRNMSFLEIHHDDLASCGVQARSAWSRTLRKQLLWDLLSVHWDDSASYSSWFRKVSTRGPVFIVIDNVHKVGQIEELVPSMSLLHPGSRVVVTSRDGALLNNAAERTKLAHESYEVSTLGSHDSERLFNLHAFGADEGPEEFDDLAKGVVAACGGLSLALKVIGSSLSGRYSDEDRKSIWPEAVDALRQRRDVMDVLGWSYVMLPEEEKRMFLDITYVFHGRSASEALAYWASCKACKSCGSVKTPNTSLSNLAGKSLVKWSDGGRLDVHDLLRELGQEMGRKAGSHYVDGRVAWREGTRTTLGLNLARSRKRKLKAENFADMPNLHFLAMPDGSSMRGDVKCMPKRLRWLQWRGMPSRGVCEGLDLSRLTALDFSRSRELVSLWAESNVSLKGCPNLLRLNLNECKSITRLPESIGESSQLKYLLLQECRNLKKLPDSIGQLKALEHLYLGCCISLTALPDAIGALSNLRTLDASGCESFSDLPSSIGGLSKLQTLEVTGCNLLLGLPTSIGHLSSLSEFSINTNASETEITSYYEDGLPQSWKSLFSYECKCSGLGSFHDLGASKSLEEDFVHDCSTFTKLPDSLGLLTQLRLLEVSCKTLQCLPMWIGNLKMLHTLWLRGCENLRRLPQTLGALTNLNYLHIRNCSIKRLPKSIGLLSRLQDLEIWNCKNFEKLPISIRELKSLEDLEVSGCGSIEAMGLLTTLQGLPIWGTTSITQLPPSLGHISRLEARNDERRPFYKADELSSVVLEEDHTGILKAISYTSNLTMLLREYYKV